VTPSYSTSLPITKSFFKSSASSSYSYEQFFTNVTITFTPTQYETTSSLYEIYFRVSTSTTTPIPSTNLFGYYFNTNVSTQSLLNCFNQNSASPNYTSPIFSVVPKNLSGTMYVNRFNLLPPGMIMASVLSNEPVGWLICDGRSINRTTYKDLYDAIGTIFGIGNGSTTFNIPDYRGAFLRGAGTNPNNSSNTSTLNTSQSDGIKNHTHPITDPGHTHTYDKSGSERATGNDNFRGADIYTSTNTSISTTGISINNNTGGINETRPYNWSINYLIKY
jgi:microcystin-dependent protein